MVFIFQICPKRDIPLRQLKRPCSKIIKPSLNTTQTTHFYYMTRDSEFPFYLLYMHLLWYTILPWVLHKYQYTDKLIQQSEIHLEVQGVYVNKHDFGNQMAYDLHKESQPVFFYGCDFSNQILNGPQVISCLLLFIHLFANQFSHL